MRRTRWLLPLWLIALLSAPGLASGADFRFQSSTQYLWYTDPFQNQDQSDIVEYVKLDAGALDANKRFSASGYGRLSKQFGGTENEAFGNDRDLLGRLYFLYFNYALPSDRGSLRLGRQFVSVGAGAGTIDGARAEIKPFEALTVTAFAGYDVRFAQTTDRSAAGDYLAGVSAGASLFTGNNVEISYLRKYDETDIIREMLGVHADQRIYGKAKAYVDWRYDILHEAESEFLAGIKIYPVPTMVTVTAEYFQAYPNFDADTIFTAFAVSRFKEASGRVDYIVGPQLTLSASYAHDTYDGPTADVATLGITATPKAVPGLVLNGSYVRRTGFPGSLDGFQASADYAFRKALVSAGLTWDVFQRDSMVDDFTAKKYWIGGSYELAKNLTAKLRVEDAETRQFSNDVQGRAALDVRF